MALIVAWLPTDFPTKTFAYIAVPKPFSGWLGPAIECDPNVIGPQLTKALGELLEPRISAPFVQRIRYKESFSLLGESLIGVPDLPGIWT